MSHFYTYYQIPSINQCVHSLAIVESIPQNLTYPGGSPLHLSTYAAWMRLLGTAMTTVDIASYYWTLRGQGNVKDVTDKQVRHKILQMKKCSPIVSI